MSASSFFTTENDAETTVIYTRKANQNRIQTQGSTARKYYRPELDVVRFLAFLAVFLHHTYPIVQLVASRMLLKVLPPLFTAPHQLADWEFASSSLSAPS